MYSIVLTDGKIINVNATEVEWCEKSRMIKLINGRQVVARINMDNVVGWINAEHKLNFNKITLGEYEEMIKPLNQEIEQQPFDDAISRQAVIDAMFGLCDDGENPHIDAITDTIERIPPVTPQESTIKALGEELRKARKGIVDEKVLIGYNLAVAICNKYLGESEE